MRFIHHERYGENLLGNKPFGKFIEKLANNGENSTVVFEASNKGLGIWDSFLAHGLKIRETGEWIGFRDLLGIGLNNHVDCLEVNQKLQKKLIRYISVEQYNKEADEKYSPLNGLDHGHLNIYVADEIDGKIHLGHGSIGMDQDAGRAAFAYLSAESILPDKPIDVDTRLNKYLNPKPNQRVALIYEDTIKDLYKNEDFIGFMEWLETSKATKDNQQIIVRPRFDPHRGAMNFMDIIIVEPSRFKPMSQDFRNMIQHFCGGLLWHGPNFDSAKIKDCVNIYHCDHKSTYPDLIKPFNACI